MKYHGGFLVIWKTEFTEEGHFKKSGVMIQFIYMEIAVHQERQLGVVSACDLTDGVVSIESCLLFERSKNFMRIIRFNYEWNIRVMRLLLIIILMLDSSH